MAGRRIRLIFASLTIDGPSIPDEMREETTDEVVRITWRHACECMADEEKIAACRANIEAIKEYSWALARKAAAKEWELVLAASK